MHRRHPLLVAALLLALSILGPSRPVLAAPAEILSSTYCDPVYLDDDGNAYQDCYTVRAVMQLTVLPSGDYKYTSNNRVTNTTTLNGVVIYDDTATHQFTDVIKAGEYQVSRSYTVTTLTITNPVTGAVRTCTISANYLVVDGEIRHQSYSDDCNP